MKIVLNICILFFVLGTLAGVWYFDTDIKKGEITEGSFISQYPAYLNFYTNVYPAINNTILVNVSYWLEYAIVNYTKSQLSFWNDYEQNVTAHAVEIIYLLLFISGVIMFIILMGLYLASYYYLTIEPDIANLEKPELALLFLSNHANELKDELEKNNCEIHYE